MACISLGKIDKNLIIIIIGCIFVFSNRLLNRYDGTYLFKNQILTSICICISRFLAVIPYIIIKLKYEDVVNDDTKIIKKGTRQLIFHNKNKEIVKGRWKFIVLSGVVFFAASILFSITFKIKTHSWIWYILIASIFYYLLFQIKLYRHHYVTIILILLSGITIDLVQGNLQNDLISNTGILLLKFLHETTFSLYNVLAKYVMEKKFVTVYEFSTYVGLISTILLIIFAIFDHFFFGLNNYSEYFQHYNGIEFLVMLGVIFTQVGINLTSLFITKYESPCHVFIIFVFGQFASYTKFSVTLLVVYILLIFILLLSLIFNEIIELNFCGLSFNVKRNIVKRARTEEDIALNDIVNDDNLDKEEELNEQYFSTNGLDHHIYN